MKFLGLLLVLVSWAAAAVLLRRWKGHNAMSISQHAASARSAQWLFGATLVLGGNIFYYWIIVWLVPKLGLSNWFMGLLAVTIVAQTTAAIIPDSDSWKRLLHRFSAYIMAILYLPLSGLILLAPNTSHPARIAGLFMLTYMVASFIIVVGTHKGMHKFLIYQALYIISFQMIILTAAYL